MFHKHDKAEDKVSYMELSLEVAFDLQGNTCTAKGHHECYYSKPESESTDRNLLHRFWVFQNPQISRKIGPYKFDVPVNRLKAFRDIQEKSGSKLGNGTSRLRTWIDADGVITKHGLAATEQETKDQPTDSWGLMRERFRQDFRQKRKERAEKRDRRKAFRDWCIGIHAVHGELYDQFLRFETMRPFDLEPILDMYGKGYTFLSERNA